MDAASNGAITAIQLILGITANLVAFVAFIAFINGILEWLGLLVGFADVSFELIFGKIFIPLAWIIGVPWEDCEPVAQLISTKMFINEFVAYEKLGVMKASNLIGVRT